MRHTNPPLGFSPLDPSLAERARSAAAVAAVISGLLGAFILYGAGLAQANMLHNAAHDARHAFTFPCH